MSFNSANISRSLDSLNPEDVISITLVYTKFKQSETFDQDELNTSRTNKLLNLYPKLKHKNIKWQWVAQTGCETPEDCKPFFHGFEIRIESEETKIALASSEALMEYYLKKYSGEVDESTLDSLIETGKSSLIKNCDTIIKERLYRSYFGKMEGTRPNSKKLFLDALKQSKVPVNAEIILKTDTKNRLRVVSGVEPEDLRLFTGILKRYYRFRTSRFEGVVCETEFQLVFSEAKGKYFSELTINVEAVDENGNSFERFEDVLVKDTTESCYYLDELSFMKNAAPDDAVKNTLERNRQWKNCVVVVDVTGSMAPYIAQFLLWHKTNLDNQKGNHDFVFFNDGDNMPNELKEVGKVGGTYFIKTGNYQALANQLYKTIRKGNGGDSQENDLEAILFGLGKCPTCTEVILIADNFSVPRDMELLKRLKVPVHVILCGPGLMNMDYVEIAQKTNGTVHTMDSDFNDPSSFKVQGTMDMKKN